MAEASTIPLVLFTNINMCVYKWTKLQVLVLMLIAGGTKKIHIYDMTPDVTVLVLYPSGHMFNTVKLLTIILVHESNPEISLHRSDTVRVKGLIPSGAAPYVTLRIVANTKVNTYCHCDNRAVSVDESAELNGQ